MPNPVLTLQTGSLYASNQASTFTGTGGPFGFSPWTSQFGGVISSAGLAGEPFNDTVYGVAAGDVVTFVIAVQNTVAGTAAYGVRLQEAMPSGFVVPTDGLGLSATDGTGTVIPVTGDLFSSSGLTLGSPVGGYDPDSGLNVALVTFTLQAAQSLPGPYATISPVASIIGYSATQGGADLSANAPAPATTAVVTAAPTPTVLPETDPSAVAKGQTVAFDVMLIIPTGSLQNLVITPVLPTGASTLDLVSASIVSIGSGLTLATPQIAANGSIAFGTVTAASGGNNVITARIVVRADGTASGPTTLQTVISAGNAVNSGGYWSATVSSSVGVVVPPPPPQLSGLLTQQAGTVMLATDPFANIAIADSNPSQTASLAITLQDGSLGRLSNPTTGSLNAAGDTFLVSGTIAVVQAAARQLAFTPGAVGTEHFNITIEDASGAIAQDSSTTLAISQPAPPDPLFDATYYLAHNPDVAAAGVDPYQHFMTRGWLEGRNPNAYFDVRYYEAANPGVAGANVNPLTQFEQSGAKQGLQPSLLFSDSAYLAANPDVAAAGAPALAHYLSYGQHEGRAAFLTGFDGNLGAADPLVTAATYDAQLGATLIPAGTAAQAQAAELYAASGWQKGLNPDAWFDTSYYLAQNPDVAAAGINPLLHFEQYGWHEGRDPSLAFSDSKYLATYADVRAAGVDPLLHYVTFGQAEGRVSFLPGGTAAADPLVNAAYYDKQLGATIVPAGTAAAQQAAASYDATGWHKGLSPDALRDPLIFSKRFQRVIRICFPKVQSIDLVSEVREPRLSETSRMRTTGQSQCSSLPSHRIG